MECENEDDFANQNEILTQEQTQAPLVDFLGIEDEYFQKDDKAKLLPVMAMDKAFSAITTNPISAETMAQLIKSNSHPFLIIDARYDYEFKAGHIKGAKNIDN